MASLRIGVDSGGTFTDVCLLDEHSGSFSVWKLPSTAHDPSEAIANGAREAVERFARGDAKHQGPKVSFFGHGTTVATNALIQGRGARAGLITNDGFRDLLELGRQTRPHLYDLQTDKPKTLIPRDRRLEVRERLLYDGTIERQLSEQQVRAAARKLRDTNVEAAAVCLLYSFVDPAHEAMVTQILEQELPGVFVTASHHVCPEFREFERLSTTVVNAFLGPVIEGYLSRLTPRLREAGIDVQPHITQSNGGTITFETASLLPVRTVLSGPSTGVVGALETGRIVGVDDIITFDMGGTSTDVSLIRNGRAETTTEAQIHGYPIKIPMIDIHTVGAGGGSIAYVDSGGFLKVGPRSAGAEPGPICYELGNDEPTVTDANVVLQILNPQQLLGGRMPINRDLAVRAIEKLGDQLGLSAVAAADGIIRVVTANMARAIRLISVQRGHDPREYCLMPFGGGGPVHAGRLARELGMRRILVPRNPGVLCALGLLLTDLRHDLSLTRRVPLESASINVIRSAMGKLRDDAESWFAKENVAPGRRRLIMSADMRYAGQNYELNVPVPELAGDGTLLDALIANFNQAYGRLYDYTAPQEAIEIVTFRAEAYGIVEKPRFSVNEDAGADASGALAGSRAVYLPAPGPTAGPESGAFVETQIYARERLRTGNRIKGPAVVEQMDSTTFILPGQAASVDPYLNLVIEEADARVMPNDTVGEAVAVEPVTVEVIGNAIASIADEMGETLIRASYSTNIKERRDCSTVIFDAAGRTLYQAEHIPIHLGSLMGVVAAILDRYELADIAEGDLFIGNDAYTGGGTHLPDIVAASPIFHAQQLVGWATNLAHHADFVDRGHAHIFQEGLRIPPIRLQRAGEMQQDVLDLILLNCQVPHERQADLRAQIASNRFGVQRFQAMCERYGVPLLNRVFDELLDYAERRMRAGIATIPDGIYRFEDRFECDELEETLTFRVSIDVKGDEIELDFANNPPQVRAGLNMVETALLATVYYAIKTVTDPDAPPNSGLFRPIKVTAEPGSILNAVSPAAVNGRTNTCQRVVDVVHGALAQAIPERIIAACNGAVTSSTFSGVNPRTGKYYIYLETLGGGFGARATKDGLDGVQVHITNTSNLPVEALESEYPLRVERYELERDSGGCGKWRGGMGFRRQIRSLHDDCRVSMRGTRVTSAPWGLFGGHDGGRYRVEADAGVAPFRLSNGVLSKGQSIAIVTPGSGGYGSPADRDPERIRQDLREDRISAQVARDVYGVEQDS